MSPLFLITLAVLIPFAGCKKEADILSSGEERILQRILDHWETWVPEKEKAGTAPLMTFEELTQGFGPEERAFLDRVRAIDPKRRFGFQGAFLGNEIQGVSFKRLDDQWVEQGAGRRKLDPQYLPQNVFEAYEAMMNAMEKELGKRLLVESGYRSAAWQLHTFLFYLPKHGYSLAETGRWIALPGYSEHGSPRHQAIDFINQEGVNGEERVEDFERLPEYEWLSAHARKFSFELSYPRGKKGITFEPWHWRYEGSQ